MDIKERDHVVICNCPKVEKILGLVGELRSDRLGKKRAYVVVSNRLDELPDQFRAFHIGFVNGDPTREEVLLRANILDPLATPELVDLDITIDGKRVIVSSFETREWNLAAFASTRNVNNVIASTQTRGAKAGDTDDLEQNSGTSTGNIIGFTLSEDEIGRAHV